jgi:ankyrin repeat protein
MELIERIKENNIEKISGLLEHVNINEKDEHGDTALHYFADNSNLEVVKLLIDHKVIIDIQNEQAESPLMRAVIKQHHPIVQKLLAEGANPNSTNKLGYSCLHKPACENDLEIMELLVSYGASIKSVTNSGSTIMHFVTAVVTQH